MSITDELREWAHRFNGPWKRNEETLLAIADRIDEAHEKALAEQYASLTIDMEPMTEENMAEGGWVRLPKDADGEYIHVGDRLDVEYTTLPLVVEDMTLYSDDWRVGGLDPATLHHYKPTVEDVLRDFAQEMNENLGMYTGEAIDADEWRDADAKTVTKYAERIREAVEHE